jgi:hypothetical protein
VPADPVPQVLCNRNAAAPYANGAPVNYTVTGLTPRNTYAICVKASDLANRKRNSN